MMHETYFGLRKRPFLATPTLDRYCPIDCQENAYATITRAIQRSEGPVTIIGGTGLGKTMVSLRIADAFRRSFEVIVLASSQICSRRALLQSLLFELRMPYRDLSEGELRLSLLERLQPSNDNPTDGLVLIVDEAQTLAPKLLEELRLITNLTREGVPRVRLVLCGTSRLEEMLGHPQMESLNQRLAARCYLMPLNSQETIRYLTYKIELCGTPISAVITEEAMRLVHRATDGVPRLIDHTVDAALRLAAEMKQRPISAALIEMAWAQSQQLPLPWSDNSQPISSSSPSVEFGLLEEDTEQDFKARDTSYIHRNEHIAEESVAGQLYGSDALYSSDASYDPEVAHYQESIGLTPNPPVAPVPSAGSGLSRSIASAWDSFIDQGDDKKGKLQSPKVELTNGYPDETRPTQPFTEEMPLQSVGDDFNAASSNTNGDLFGIDYEEEQWLVDLPPIDAPLNGSKSRSNPTAWSGQQPLTIPEDVVYPSYNFEHLGTSEVPIEIISDDQIDSSLYAFRDNQQQSIDIAASEALELLDEISSSNLEAMTMSPGDTIAGAKPTSTTHLHTMSEVSSNGRVVRTPSSQSKSSLKKNHASLSKPPRASILSFADLQQDSIDVLQDDRDLLIIEEDVMHMAAGMPTASVNDAISQATVHPYKQLFSKLRG